MSVLQRPLTYDDLLEMPDDGMRREVIDGELVVTPAPSIGHQRVLGNLFRLLDAYARDAGGEVLMAPIDVRLTPFDIVQPDLIVLSAGVERLRGDQQTVENAPNVVIEIISRGSGRTDRVRKMALYARSGVPEYWIVDPFERAITVNVLEGQRYVAADSDASGRIDSQSLPGMTLDPAEVFSGVD